MRATRLALALVILAPGPGAAVVTARGFVATVAARGLEQPTTAEFAPDGRLFILEKAGRVRLWTAAGGLRAAPLLTLPVCSRSEMGLLGAAVDPQFASNGRLYLYHTMPPGGDPARCGTVEGRENRIVRVTVRDDAVDPASLVVLFAGIRTDNGNHDGGDLEIGPDGHLYVGVGDAGVGDRGAPGESTNPYARDVTSPNGKILRLTLDGQAAPGNPFVGRGGAAAAVFAYGLRNPWRIAFQPSTGLLWVADVGQLTWEEIDVVRAGDDLGWPRCEGRAPSPPCPGDTVPPVYQYSRGARGASVTGGVFYDGALFPSDHRGSYFFGDFVRDVVWRAIPTATNDGFTGPPAVVARDVGSPVDFTVGPDGALYVVAFATGEVLRIAPETASSASDGCRMRLGDASRALIDRVGRGVARCLRGGACTAPAGAARRVGRRLAPACTPPPPDLCAAFGCAGCATARDLARCAADAAVAPALAARLAAAGRSRCARTAYRAGVALAAAQAAAGARCRRAGAAACPRDEAAAARAAARIARPCATPPAELCAALECDACTDGAGLAACVVAHVTAAVDTYTFRVYGTDASAS